MENNSRMAGRKFGAQFLQIFQRAGFGEFFDLGRDRFADARNFGRGFFVLQVRLTLPPHVSIERAALA